MADPEFTLELLGPIIVGMRDEMRDKFDAVERRLAVIEEERLPAIERGLTGDSEEMPVLSAMVLRYSAEPIAWGAMQSEIRALRERIEALETER